LACANCGSTDLDVSGGDELLLESIRVDRETAAAS
jgi:Zn finger protein HypA/HybF involved in hydrogenase expression